VCLFAWSPLFTFDDSALGARPDGFVFAAARQALPGLWEVRGSGARRHLIHAGDPTVTMRGISVATVSAAAPADIRVTARVRLVDGDRAGGVVWRFRDANNFYFMALDLTAHTAAVVRVTGGNRILLDIVRDINLDADSWHTVSVTHEGAQIHATVNGIGVLQARDGVIPEGGRAGLWSAGNSTTWFDDLALDDFPE